MSLRRKPKKSTWLVDRYLAAKEVVIARGYAAEVDWQTAASLDAINESEFLRESSWVILSAGMRETIVRRHFAALSAAFLDWTSAKAIHHKSDRCRAAALAIFAHPRKISAIVDLVAKVCTNGFDRIKAGVKEDGVTYLQQFDYIGPVTCFHLAKNLGLDCVKPDRHLVRLAASTGSKSPLDLCRILSDATGDRLAVVDLVLWRFATLQSDYVHWFSPSNLDRAA